MCRTSFYKNLILFSLIAILLSGPQFAVALELLTSDNVSVSARVGADIVTPPDGPGGPGGPGGTDVCPNISGTQTLIPTGLVINALGQCVSPQQCDLIDGALKQPLDVMIIIDKSGSMAGIKLTQAKNAAIAFVNNLVLGSDRVGYVTYSNTATLVSGLTTSFDTVKTKIAATTTNGNTNIGGGAKVAFDEINLNGRIGVKHVIVLLTDGEANVSDMNTLTPNQYAITQASFAKVEGTVIYSIGLGTSVDANLLRSVATLPSYYYYSPTGNDLSNIYLQIAAIECTAAPSKVSDFVVHDTNDNGLYDDGELGLSGAEISLISVNNSQPTRTAMSLADGSYSFSFVPSGGYSLCNSSPSGMHQTFPNFNGCYNITVTQGLNITGTRFLIGGDIPPFCTIYYTDPSCKEEPFCTLFPDDPICTTPTFCMLNPEDPSCITPEYCALYPTDPLCTDAPFCTLYPDDPICINPPICAINPADPSCIGTRPFCELNPTDPSCNGTPTFCDLHPTDPSCILQPFCLLNPTDTGCIELPFCTLHPNDSSCISPSFCSLHPENLLCKVSDGTSGILEIIGGIINKPIANAITKIIETTGAATGIIGLASLAFSGPVALLDIPLVLLRLWNLILALLGLRRRRTPWGTVYDSVTKQPLDPVYVVLQDLNGKEIATSITDLDGRYGFLVTRGQYRIIVNKTNYIFPSKKLFGKTEDELYQGLYFSEIIDVKEDGEVITKNIPMDPVNFDWNEFAKRDQKLLSSYSRRDVWVARIADILFIAGFIFTIIACLVSPMLYNYIIFAFYILMLALKRTVLKPRSYGRIRRKENQNPLSFAIIRIFFAGSEHEVAHKVADESGKYYCLVPNGKYYTKIENKNLDESYSLVNISEPIEVKKGYINKEFEV